MLSSSWPCPGYTFVRQLPVPVRYSVDTVCMAVAVAPLLLLL